MTIEDYVRIKGHLNSPQEAVLESVEHFHSYNPPEDSGWTLDQELDENRSIQRMLSRLPRKQQIKCAYTAAKIVLPLYEKIISNMPSAGTMLPLFKDVLSDLPEYLTEEDRQLIESQRNLPYEAIQEIDRTLQGNFDEEIIRGFEGQLVTFRSNLVCMADQYKYYDLIAAGKVCSSLTYLTYDIFIDTIDPMSDIEEGLCYAIEDAADAFVGYNLDLDHQSSKLFTPEALNKRKEFLNKWWDICKCKLAFADAHSAELI